MIAAFFDYFKARARKVKSAPVVNWQSLETLEPRVLLNAAPTLAISDTSPAEDQELRAVLVDANQVSARPTGTGFTDIAGGGDHSLSLLTTTPVVANVNNNESSPINETQNLTVFQPQSKSELQTAVNLWISDKTAALSTHGEINTWDTSLITDMSELFRYKTTFNDDISNWDVSNVTTMYRMFNEAKSFNQDLSSWDVSNVTNMFRVFNEAESFNQDISSWDVSNVTDMSAIFKAARAFNQDISSWNVSNVTNMSEIFMAAEVFNQDLSSWDVSNVTNMLRAFCFAYAFNENISSWNVSSVTIMSEMFRGASAFNSDISSWDIGATSMNLMFSGATNFNQDLSSWDVSNVTNMEWMFDGNALSDANKCYIQKTFSSNDAWSYDWSDFCPFTPQTKSELQAAVNLWISDKATALTTHGAINTWDTSLITSMSTLFHGKADFNDDISEWDVSNVTSMTSMFKDAKSFNQDISDWDVSSLTSMENMFWGAESFNQDIGGWDVSNVTHAKFAFAFAKTFNQDLNEWDVSQWTSMYALFYNALSFNGNISSWNVSNVHTMYAMFEDNINFNQDISTKEVTKDGVTYTAWDVSNVTNMNGMFINAEKFNQDISNWDVSKVTKMQSMFNQAESFNQDIGGWDMSNVEHMSAMFSRAEAFNQDIGNWNLASVKGSMGSMFRDTLNFNQDLLTKEVTKDGVTYIAWDLSNVDRMDYMFEGATKFNGDISNWDTSSVTNMYWMFMGATDFNRDINNWDVSKVTNMERMFNGATSFNQDLNDWDVSSVTRMYYMFLSATNFNGDISNWEPKNVTDMSKMFEGTSFNQDISDWDVSSVITMYQMFRGTPINQDLNDWDVSNVTRMDAMFWGAANFNGDISNWDTSSVTRMNKMFYKANKFNQDISTKEVTKDGVTYTAWDVSNVTRMGDMFHAGLYKTSLFNQDISNWDVSKVTDMEQMFYYATSFNQDLNWNVSSVTDFSSMFYAASSFDQDLSSWDISSATNMRDMFKYAGVSDTNKCYIHKTFSSNDAWPYDWSEFCAPTDIALTNTVSRLAENSDTIIATKMGDIVITDVDGGDNQVVLSGVDAAWFEVAGSELFLKAGVGLNYETQSSYAVTLATGNVSVDHTLSITDVNDAPTGSVTISGTATEDETLTAANNLADEDGLGEIGYQWNRDGNAIDSATSETYTLTQEDVGTAITVTASYTDQQDANESVTSAATGEVANVNDAPVLTISGVVTEDQVLPANLSDEDGLGNISYQWNHGGVAIDGATSSTYTLTQTDVGSKITVTVSYTDGQGTSETVTSDPTGIVHSNIPSQLSGHLVYSGVAVIVETQTVNLAGFNLAATGLVVEADGMLAGYGSVSAPVSGSGSIELVDGNMSLGDLNDPSGFDFDGTLKINGHATVLLDANVAKLGAVTDLASGGTLDAANGMELASGRSLVGSGTVHGDLVHQGTITIAENQTVVIRGNLSGSGVTDGAGTLVVTATYTPGNSPAVIEFGGDLDFGANAHLVLEINGAEPGSGYDQLNIAGDLGAGGTLEIVLGENYKPVGGELFDLFKFSSVSGVFSQVTFSGQALDDHLLWNDSKLYSDGTITVADTLPPVITLVGDPAMTLEETRDTEYVDAGATCTDNVDGNLNHAVVVSGQIVNLQVPDTYTIQYNCSDLSGNLAQSVTRTVTVVNVNDAPTGTVTISGTAREDETLMASNDLADEDGLGALSYQWNRDGAAVPSATAETYTLTQADVGSTLTVTARYTDAQGTAESVTSAATAAVANVNDAPTGTVTISGTATEDEILTASNDLSDEDGLGEIGYQWNRDGNTIDGAASSTYTLTQADVGMAITASASYTDAFGNSHSVASVGTLIVTNVNDVPIGAVTISGTATEDEILTARNDLADEDGLGNITYQWVRTSGGTTTNINGAAAASYTLTQEDVGSQITVTAGYTDDQGTDESVTSAATEVVSNVNDVPVGEVLINGTAMEDETLAASNNLSDEEGLGVISYQWNRDGSPISSATTDTYVLTQEDVGSVITVTASYTDGHGTAESVTSLPTDTVASSSPAPLLGDANNDGQVTGRDLIVVQQNFGNIGSDDGLLYGDANDDGQVTGADLIIVQQNFGNVAAPVSAFDAVDSSVAVSSSTIEPNINPFLVGDWTLRSINGQLPQGTEQMSFKSFSKTDQDGFAGMNLFLVL